MSEKAPTTVKELAKALADLTSRIDVKYDEMKRDLVSLIKTELDPVKQAMNFINESFEAFRAEMQTLKGEIAKVKDDNREMKNNNLRLAKELGDIRKELTDMQQYSRKTNLEIKGIPFARDEDLTSTMKAISTCIGSEIAESDIEVIHRVPSKDKEKPNIIVKFHSRKVRDRVLRAAKKQRLNTSTLGFKDSSPVFVNEHLCPANKVLLAKSLNAKREKNWKFAWVSDGKVLMRKTENSRVLHVTCAEDLERVQ